MYSYFVPDLDECASYPWPGPPCHNGGTCENMENSYSCTCTEDYIGIQCDVYKYSDYGQIYWDANYP